MASSAANCAKNAFRSSAKRALSTFSATRSSATSVTSILGARSNALISSAQPSLGSASGQGLQSSRRSIHTLDYGPDLPKEDVFERADYPKNKILDILKNEKIAVLGYGPQGKGQAQNLRDTGVKNLTVGVREGGESWVQAKEDGWVPGESLKDIVDAVKDATIVMFLLSDAAQIQRFPDIAPHLEGKTLYFSHGFGVVYSDLTNIKLDKSAFKNLDVILCAPKGSGKSVRDLYLKGSGINASYAIHRDDSGKATDKALAIGFGVGAPYIYKTTFVQEVTSDLMGERCVLMGAIAGLFKAQYDVLRKAGHSPSEAYNETVEEALCSLYPLINEKGMDYMFSHTSVTAQRGALDWSKKFETLNRPLIQECYDSVKDKKEAKRVIDACSHPGYRDDLRKELAEIDATEIWRVAREVRKLRPKQ